MKRILIRSGKSPFQVASVEEMIQKDLIGTNSGNLLFSDAAHKMLLTDKTEVTSNGIRTDSSAKRAAEINEQYDVFVIPLANAFRPSFEAPLNRLSSLIEKLTIPVVVLGVGAQTGADYNMERMQPLGESVKRFLKAVLDRSPSIGVRGELTEKYVKSLGFNQVDVIGCPSMFYHGPEFSLRTPQLPFTDTSKIAINASHAAVDVGEIGKITRHVHSQYPNLLYIPQNLSDAEMLYWGDTSEVTGSHSDMPEYRTHPLFQDNKVRLFHDSIVWMNELRKYDFAFGTRIHGNIAALLAGTPSVVLCHDSRTLELCRYFDIPYQMLADTPPDIDLTRLYQEADFAPLVDGHQERFDRFVSFLDQHGLENTFSHGDKGAAYEDRMAKINFPEPLGAWDGSADASLAYRMAWLHQRAGQTSRHEKRIAELNKRNKQLEKHAAELEQRLARIEARQSRTEKSFIVRLGPSVRRRSRKLFKK